MTLAVKIFSIKKVEDMEIEMNKWLRENRLKKVIDIKYNGTMTGSEACIIYEAD